MEGNFSLTGCHRWLLPRNRIETETRPRSKYPLSLSLSLVSHFGLFQSWVDSIPTRTKTSTAIDITLNCCRSTVLLLNPLPRSKKWGERCLPRSPVELRLFFSPSITRSNAWCAVVSIRWTISFKFPNCSPNTIWRVSSMSTTSERSSTTIARCGWATTIFAFWSKRFVAAASTCDKSISTWANRSSISPGTRTSAFWWIWTGNIGSRSRISMGSITTWTRHWAKRCRSDRRDSWLTISLACSSAHRAFICLLFVCKRWVKRVEWIERELRVVRWGSLNVRCNSIRRVNG